MLLVAGLSGLLLRRRCRRSGPRRRRLMPAALIPGRLIPPKKID